MPAQISPLAQVDRCAHIAADVAIGPFCLVGPHVHVGPGCRLDSHVTIVGHSTIGARNRFFPNSVIGGEPQDIGYSGSDTRLEIGDDNLFREGVTVNRGAEKEDHCTRIGNGNMFMSNSHVAHNCWIHNKVILVNGVLLGGHVHIHDGAIVSGNSVVHHFSTLGTLSFVSGGCRVPHDVPPYMLAAGSDNPTLRTINLVGMRRAGISETAISAVKRAFRLLFREHKKVAEARCILAEMWGANLPPELETLLAFVERQQRGRMGRAREVGRDQNIPTPDTERRRAA